MICSMEQKLLIKVCGMRDPQNFREIDTLNPDYLGIIFYLGSPRNMDKNPDALPETKAKRVGVFVNASVETIIKKAREFKLSTLQLHGKESPEMCLELLDMGYDVFKSFRIDEKSTPNEIKRYKGTCSAFLFDTKTDLIGGSGEKFNWKKLDELAHIDKFILSGGINANDVAAIKELNYENLIGIDLNSKFEIKPGIKDPELLNQFLCNFRNNQPCNKSKILVE